MPLKNVITITIVGIADREGEPGELHHEVGDREQERDCGEHECRPTEISCSG